MIFTHVNIPGEELISHVGISEGFTKMTWCQVIHSVLDARDRVVVNIDIDSVL